LAREWILALCLCCLPRAVPVPRTDIGHFTEELVRSALGGAPRTDGDAPVLLTPFAIQITAAHRRFHASLPDFVEQKPGSCNLLILRSDWNLTTDKVFSGGFAQPWVHFSREHLRLVETSKPIADLTINEFDAVLLIGGQGPMYTFFNDERVHRMAAQFYEAGKVLAVICHATCILLNTRLSNGSLLVSGKTWTGFANSEKQYADDYVGQRIQRSGSKVRRASSRIPTSS
jgi:putative intracellular protease/amidase